MHAIEKKSVNSTGFNLNFIQNYPCINLHNKLKIKVKIKAVCSNYVYLGFLGGAL